MTSVRPSVNFYIFRFTAYISYPYQLKLVRMILDISPHNRSRPVFSISLPGGAVVARLLEFSNRFTAYSIHTIQLKLGRMILDISPHNRPKPDY